MSTVTTDRAATLDPTGGEIATMWPGATEEDSTLTIWMSSARAESFATPVGVNTPTTFGTVTVTEGHRIGAGRRFATVDSGTQLYVEGLAPTGTYPIPG